jgi:hypothetical protein
VMNKLKGIVNNGSGTNSAWAMNLATNNLANRAGVREMAQGQVSGQLHAQPLPAGATPTNNPPLQVGTSNRNPNGTLENTYQMTAQNTPQQLQADYAIFKKGPSEPGYLGALVRLSTYFGTGRITQAPAAVPGTPTDPKTAMTNVGLNPNYTSSIGLKERYLAGY